MSWFTRWLRRRLSPAARRPAPRPRVEALEDRRVPTVQYFGGNLLPHVEAQALYLGNEWSSSSTTPQPATLDNFLTTLTGGAYMDALTNAGYNVGRGTDTAGIVDSTINGTTLAAGTTITDASIQAEIQAEITKGVSRGGLQSPDANSLYVVYVEPNVAVNLGAGQGTTQQGILGYHGAFAGTDASGKAATIRYAVIAYPGGTVGNSSLGTSATDQLTAVASHEVAEAVTDPDVNFSRLGWYDPRRGEIGDVTENNPNAYVRLGSYLVQEVAGQNDQLLSITSSPPSTNPPPTTLTTTTSTLTAGSVVYHRFGPPTVTLTVVITPAAGSTVAPGGTVALLYNGSVLGYAQVHVVNGVAEAVFNVAFYQSGNYTFSAQYLGSSVFQGSTSNNVTVKV